MKALRILSLLFCFKKPQIKQLSYIHVLVKDKPTLLIVWEIKNVLSVKLYPLNHRYFDSNKALVISIPKEQQQFSLKAANFWRKKRITLNIQPVALDEVTAAELINGFRPLNKLEVAAPIIFRINNMAAIKPTSIQQKHTCIKKIERFNINIQHINYH